MSKHELLTAEEFIQKVNEAGWSVQANGLVLCPRRGAQLSLSADRTRGYLHLNSGTRTLIDTRSWGQVMPPPEIMVDGIRIVSFERADLRDSAVLSEAATLIRDLGETEGVLTRQGGYRNSVEVRTGGVTVSAENRDPRHGGREIRFYDDPAPARLRKQTPGFLMGVLAMCGPALD